MTRRPPAASPIRNGRRRRTASFDWEPTVYSISDGETSIRTLFAPHTYGDDPTYTVQGVYHFADGRPDLAATVYFQDNEATQVIAYTDNERQQRDPKRQRRAQRALPQQRRHLHRSVPGF